MASWHKLRQKLGQTIDLEVRQGKPDLLVWVCVLAGFRLVLGEFWVAMSARQAQGMA